MLEENHFLRKGPKGQEWFWMQTELPHLFIGQNCRWICHSSTPEGHLHDQVLHTHSISNYLPIIPTSSLLCRLIMPILIMPGLTLRSNKAVLSGSELAQAGREVFSQGMIPALEVRHTLIFLNTATTLARSPWAQNFLLFFQLWRPHQLNWGR